MNFFYRVAHYFLKGCFHLFYRCHIYGIERIPPGAALIASNHTSFLDPPLLGGLWPEEIHFLARASLFEKFPLNILLRWLNTHPVQGTVQDIASFRFICKLLREGQKVVIFPEGNRSDTGHLQPIKSGISMLALKTNCPIIPVSIQGAFEAWPRHQIWPKPFSSIQIAIGHPLTLDCYAELDKKEAQRKLAEDLGQALKDLEGELSRSKTLNE